MAEITAAIVNEFRKSTGLGLMECKALLKEADGDVKKAMTLAKERGKTKAEGRAGRAATAGRIEVVIAADGKSGAMVELGCETDFVAKNDQFRKAAKELADHVLNSPDTKGDRLDDKLKSDPTKTIRDVLLELNTRTGENVTLSRAVRFAGNGLVDSYVHLDGKSGALVELEGVDDPALVKEVAMQAVGARPRYLKREEVPAEVVEEQKRIFAAQVVDKPEPVREKIALGKLESWYGESVLNEQVLVKDSSKKVRDLLKAHGPNAAIGRFALFLLGESSAS